MRENEFIHLSQTFHLVHLYFHLIHLAEFLSTRINSFIMFRCVFLITLLAVVFARPTDPSEPVASPTTTSKPHEKLVEADVDSLSDAISQISKKLQEESKSSPRFYSFDHDSSESGGTPFDLSRFEMIFQQNPLRAEPFPLGSIEALIADPRDRVQRIRNFIRDRIDSREFRQVDCSSTYSPFKENNDSDEAAVQFKTFFRDRNSDGQMKCYTNYGPPSSHRVLSQPRAS